ncbi:hypothetical protein [Spirosoma gilvum]
MDQTDTAVTLRLQKDGKMAFDTLFRSLYTGSVALAYVNDLSWANYTYPPISSGLHARNRYSIIR